MKSTAANARTREFPLAPLHRMTWPLLAALWAILLLAGFLTSPHQQPPHNPVPWWMMIVFGSALLPALLLSMLAHRSIRTEGDTLVAAGALIVSRKIAIRDLALDKARVLNLDEHTEFMPLLRLYGISLPGFTAGYCILRNRSRAFCLLTTRRSVLLLPQRDGKYLLLSPEKPQAMLDALRAG